MKSTFITLCGEDGAESDDVKRVTHTPSKRDAFDGYDRSRHWTAMCAAVAKLQIARKRVASKLVSIK